MYIRQIKDYARYPQYEINETKKSCPVDHTPEPHFTIAELCTNEERIKENEELQVFYGIAQKINKVENTIN